MSWAALSSRADRTAARIRDELFYLVLCFRSGLFGIDPPRKTAAVVSSLARYGLLGGTVAVAGIRHGQRRAVIDEHGSITYRELDDRVNAIANEWMRRGLVAGDGVSILARNHRGFLEAVFAAAKCGARIILLNTGFSGPQIREVLAREGTDMLVYDEEYRSILGEVTVRHGHWLSWSDSEPEGDETIESLARIGSAVAPGRPRRAPRVVILTSGTTGAPKGAGRDVPWSLSPVGGPLSKVPFRAGGVTELSAPLFHALGFTQGLLGVGLGATLVLHRRFDARGSLDSIEHNRVDTLVVVPVMLQRMLSADAQDGSRRDYSSLRIIYISGSQLGAELCRRAGEVFGPVLYNLYGSTEVAYATIATPEDLAVAPGSVGKVVRGASVKILGDDNRELPPGVTGRVFVGNSLEFEGYTGGGDKERVGGLISSGDVGHFDDGGRLFIDGRDDEMIISGGENVFPAEVEELLGSHQAVVEVAAVGVDDEQFGQRLKVFVVLAPGAELSAEQLKDHVRENLAAYKVPREVVFLEELPRNSTGKVLKRQLLLR